MDLRVCIYLTLALCRRQLRFLQRDTLTCHSSVTQPSAAEETDLMYLRKADGPPNEGGAGDGMAEWVPTGDVMTFL